jgi:shikimate kinase
VEQSGGAYPGGLRKLCSKDRESLMKLVLIGFMGTGKSSVGQQLAKLLQYDFIDTDQLIEARQGRSITAIFETEGEAGFRRMEADLARELSALDRVVIATGGGFPLSSGNIEVLRETGVIILLTAAPETIYQRVKNERHRPLLADADPLARIVGLLETRAAVYREADITIDTTGKNPSEIAMEIREELSRRGKS